MFKKIAGVSLVSAFAIMSVAGIAMAETAKATTKEDLAKKKVSEITCEDFNGLDESFKPTVITWITGFHVGDDKDSDETVIDVDGIEKVTPFIVEACQAEPKASFWKKAEAELKKVF